MSGSYLLICFKYVIYLFFINALFCLLFMSNAYAGIVGELSDLGFRIALISIWKGLGGLALFVAGSYMIANRRPFRYRITAFAAGLMLISMTVIGIFLFIGEFWPVISAVVIKTAALVKQLFF